MTQSFSTGREARRVMEQRSGDETESSSEAPDLTLSEAASVFAVSEATLRRLVTAGVLPAYRVTGMRGREWRVSATALQEAGYSRRVLDVTDNGQPAEVRHLADSLRTERARVADLDRQLGYALLTIGRLRGRLREAGIDPDELFGADLEAGPPQDGEQA